MVGLLIGKRLLSYIMKRFVSRYEKIRHLRAQQEQVCRSVAAARNAERNQAESARDQVQQWLTETQAAAAGELSQNLSGAIFQSVTSQIGLGLEQLRQADTLLLQAEQLLRDALQQHQAARTELKIVEEVIHREHTEHRKQQLRQQEHQLLEQASQAYFRQQEISRSSDE